VMGVNPRRPGEVPIRHIIVVIIDGHIIPRCTT
jgi:hypothetical protein